MARTISASVGRLGSNRYDDVVTVQELLNQVPPEDGGPQPKLEVDGLCGPKTTRAIQLFQRHHFGWSGTDGRVDPEHQTLARLNEYDKPQAPPGTTRELRIRKVGAKGAGFHSHRDWFFQVVHATGPPHTSVYFLGPRGANAGLRTPTIFRGTWRHLTTTTPYAAGGLACPADYFTECRLTAFLSKLRLRLPSGTVVVYFDDHLKPGPSVLGPPLFYGVQRGGPFQLVQ